jgi:hypothetical protein
MRKETVTQSAARQISADFPEPGYYAVKLIKDGPLIPLRIWLEREFDEAGDQMADDVIKCLVDGREADWRKFWPYCAKHEISAEQYARMRKDDQIEKPVALRAPLF